MQIDRTTMRMEARRTAELMLEQIADEHGLEVVGSGNKRRLVDGGTTVCEVGVQPKRLTAHQTEDYSELYDDLEQFDWT